MRVALLSYRSKPHCGGQGVYLRHLSRELVALGHEVEVFSGQPYPELDAGVRLTEVPSLDLYREPDPFRTPASLRDPRPRRRRGGADHVDGRLPRAAHLQPPRAAPAARAGRRLRRRPRQPDPGLGPARRRGGDRPPAGRRPSTTRSASTGGSTWPSAPSLRKRLTLRRWYGFVRMQARVAQEHADGADAVGVLAAPTSSASSASTRPGSASVLLGVDDSFVPPTEPRVPGPDPGHGQRRRADEGDRDPARGVRQAPHRAPGARAAAGHQADRRRPHRAAARRAVDPRPRALRARHQRRRAGRA